LSDNLRLQTIVLPQLFCDLVDTEESESRDSRDGDDPKTQLSHQLRRDREDVECDHLLEAFENKRPSAIGLVRIIHSVASCEPTGCQGRGELELQNDQNISLSPSAAKTRKKSPIGGTRTISDFLGIREMVRQLLQAPQTSCPRSGLQRDRVLTGRSCARYRLCVELVEVDVYLFDDREWYVGGRPSGC
jgi:hypothetical protein